MSIIAGLIECIGLLIIAKGILEAFPMTSEKSPLRRPQAIHPTARPETSYENQNTPGTYQNKMEQQTRTSSPNPPSTDSTINLPSYFNRDNKESGKIDTFDFGFKYLSNEEIRSQFDIIHLKDPNKEKLISQLSNWIEEQVRQSGELIAYPVIYHKANQFVQLYF